MANANSTLDQSDYLPIVRQALAEDVGPGDATSIATVPKDWLGRAHMVAREPVVTAGLPVALAVFQEVSDQIQLVHSLPDGQTVIPGERILELTGPAQSLLTAERVALNFVQRLSGIATLTSRFIEAVTGTKSRILDTRKTTPGWRSLERYAVRCGGGENHRFGLYDMVMIKDNHLAALGGTLPNPVAVAVRRAREMYPDLKVEVEADTMEQVQWAIDSGADRILLDNMNLDELRQAVSMVEGRVPIEASGGVSLETVRSIAETGVDFISVGALTHSYRSVDISLELSLEPGESA